MKALHNPVAGDHLLNPATSQVRSEMAEWFSKYEFSRIELGFFSRLLDKAFLRITSLGMQEELERLEKSVRTFSNTSLNSLHKNLVDYEKKLSDAYKTGLPVVATILQEERSALLHNMQEFDKAMVVLKREIFSIVEHQVKLAREIDQDYQSGHLAL